MLKVLIVDDEELARREMRQLLASHPETEVVGEAGDVASALELTARWNPHLVLLDIQLAGESGFDYVKQAGEPAPHIAFVTAYGHHAVQAFECEVMYYLLKPVRPERLAKSLRRAREKLPDALTAEGPGLVVLKSGTESRAVPWRMIRSVVSSGNYTKVHLDNGEAFLMLRPLKEWMALAPDAHFLQIHRTALVRREGVREVRFLGERKCQVVFADGTALPVGRGHLAALRAALGIG